MKKIISFVIPCLNEELTLPLVLKKINHLKMNELKDREVEIIVSDNGSNDNSITIANELGARINHCSIRGYGAALNSGILAANGEIIIFADADDTYDFLEAPKLIHKLEEGYEYVIGSRLDGTIHKGAMPFLHRYVGTPVINFIINSLYAKSTKVRDANSGFRCFLKSSYLKWNIKSTGMEFASELLIKSLLFNAKTANVPISLYPDKEGRTPHLKTWRDGMRHLLRILLYAPNFFERIGLLIFFSFLGILVFGYFKNLTPFMGTNIFGIHTLLISSFASLIGLSIWGCGLFLSSRVPNPSFSYKWLLNLSEDTLFFLLITIFLLAISLVAYVFYFWANFNFQFLNMERELLMANTIFLILIQIILISLTAHILKRSE